MNWKKNLLSFLLGLSGVFMKAQTPVSFTSDQGLSNTCIRSIMEDSRKNVWISTQSGLNRYDGVKMNVYRHKKGEAGTLGHDMVSMTKLSGDSIYVCTAGYGLYRLCEDEDGKKFLKEMRDFPPAKVTLLQIFEDREKRVWFVDADGGIHCSKGGKLRRVASYPGAIELCQSSSGHLYLATAHDGLLCYSEKENRFYDVFPESRRYVMASINPGLEGQILISTDGDGLKIYDEATGRMNITWLRLT